MTNKPCDNFKTCSSVAVIQIVSKDSEENLCQLCFDKSRGGK